jgi:hypothetical protein
MTDGRSKGGRLTPCPSEAPAGHPEGRLWQALPAPRPAWALGSVLAAIGRELNRPKSTKKDAVS